MMDLFEGLFIGGFMLVVYAVLYVIFTFPYYMLAKKAEHKHAWFAFVPILNVVQMLQIAQLSLWLIVLLLVPFINFFVSIYMIYSFLKAFERSGIEVLLLIIPLVNILYLYYLAVSNNVQYAHKIDYYSNSSPYPGAPTL